MQSYINKKNSKKNSNINKNSKKNKKGMITYYLTLSQVFP